MSADCLAELGMNWENNWKIITEDLDKWKVCTKMVLKLVKDDHTCKCVKTSSSVLKQNQTY